MAFSIGFDIFAKDRASDTFDKLGKKVGDTEGKVSKSHKAFAVGAAAAGVALTKFAGDSVAAYTEAEASQRVLTDAYSRFPALADVSIQSLREMAAAQQDKTKFDGDEVAAAMGTLASYKITGKQLKELTPLVLDYAEKTGKSLPDAAKSIGMAMMGQTRALKEVGINIPKTADATKTLTKAQDGAAKASKAVREAQQKLADLEAVQHGKAKLGVSDAIAMRNAKAKLKDALGEERDALDFVSTAQKNASKTGGKFDEIVGGLRKQVGGFAAKEGLSAEGRAAILKNKFGDLQETVGSKLQPALERLTDAGIKVVDWMGKNEGKVKVLGTAIGVLVVGIGGIVAITKVYTAVQTALNVVMAMNPIGLVVIAIALLAAGLVIAYKKSETFRNIVQGAFRGIATAATWMWNTVLQPVITGIIKGYGKVFTAIGTVLSALGHVPGFGWAKAAGEKMLAAGRGADKLADSIRKIPNKSVKVTVGYAVTGSIMAAQDARLKGARAKGGPTQGGEPYLVGENGPEIWSDPRNGHITNAADTARILAGRGGSSAAAGGGAQPIIINVNGQVYGTTRELANVVLNGLQQLKGSGVKLGLGT